MIAIKNLLFQPLTFQLADRDQGLHLGPRESRIVSEENISDELKAAAARGLVSLTEVVEAPEAQPKAPSVSRTRSKATPKGKATATPRRPKRGGKP